MEYSKWRQLHAFLDRHDLKPDNQTESRELMSLGLLQLDRCADVHIHAR